MDDLLVVGLDHSTGQEAYVGAASIEYWRSKSYRRGDGTLVCLHCYEGDEAPPGTVVPLVVRHRVGGSVRAHFAHPPGMAPPNGHHPETVWHSASKHTFALWAQRQPGVADVVMERSTPDGARRSDVMVTFDGGGRVAIELQHGILHDDDWRQRHADYRRNGIADVWVWSWRTPVPWIVATEGQPIMYFHLGRSDVATMVAKPHPRTVGWFDSADISMYAEHSTPCPRDPADFRVHHLDKWRLDPNGLIVSNQITEYLTARQQRVREEAESARAEHQRRAHTLAEAQGRAALGPPHSAPARPTDTGLARPPSPIWPLARPLTREPGVSQPNSDHDVNVGRRQADVRRPPRLCDYCGEHLDEFTYHDTTRHVTCAQEAVRRKSRRR